MFNFSSNFSLLKAIYLRFFSLCCFFFFAYTRLVYECVVHNVCSPFNSVLASRPPNRSSFSLHFPNSDKMKLFCVRTLTVSLCIFFSVAVLFSLLFSSFTRSSHFVSLSVYLWPLCTRCTFPAACACFTWKTHSRIAEHQTSTGPLIANRWARAVVFGSRGYYTRRGAWRCNF